MKERKSWALEELKLLKAAKLHAKRCSQAIYQPGDKVLIWQRQAKTNLERATHKKLISVFEGQSPRDTRRRRG